MLLKRSNKEGNLHKDESFEVHKDVLLICILFDRGDKDRFDEAIGQLDD